MMKYRKLETLSEAWAFYENVKAYPVERVVMANCRETHSLRFDKFFVEEFLDYLGPDEETIRLTNFESWAKYCEDAVVSGYSGGVKRFWQLPRAVQRECYKFAQLHSYCSSPASKQWAH
jgi:hypothetical protein